jgi:hypothetical protein
MDSNTVMVFQAARDKQIALIDTRAFKVTHYLSFATVRTL